MAKWWHGELTVVLVWNSGLPSTFSRLVPAALLWTFYFVGTNKWSKLWVFPLLIHIPWRIFSLCAWETGLWWAAAAKAGWAGDVQWADRAQLGAAGGLLWDSARGACPGGGHQPCHLDAGDFHSLCRGKTWEGLCWHICLKQPRSVSAIMILIILKYGHCLMSWLKDMYSVSGYCRILDLSIGTVGAQSVFTLSKMLFVLASGENGQNLVTFNTYSLCQQQAWGSSGLLKQ